MSALTGNQIKNTYQGLLKLADSSTGITQNFQSIQDGLGNDTGIRIAEGQMEIPNVISAVVLQPRYYTTTGMGTNTVQYAAGTQNIILALPFYDNGNWDYSAMTYNLINATSTSDTVEAAIYSSQIVPQYGLYPHTPVVSGITLTTTGSTGLKTYTFGSPISMSGYGGGIYWLVYKITNAGVQPTVRFGSNPSSVQMNSVAFGMYGYVEGSSANVYNSTFRANGSNYVFSGLTTFDNPYGGDIQTKQSTTANIAGGGVGFLLNTVNG